MNSEKNITRGGLSGKMEGYRPVPPEGVWDGIAAAMHGKQSRRKLFILLGAAAGFALAVTVGITLFSDSGKPGIVMNDAGLKDQPGSLVPGEDAATIAPSSTGTNGPGGPGTGHGTGPGTGYSDPDMALSESGTGNQHVRLEDRVIAAFREVQEEKRAEGEQRIESGLAPEQAFTGNHQSDTGFQVAAVAGTSRYKTPEGGEELLQDIPTATDPTKVPGGDVNAQGERSGEEEVQSRAQGIASAKVNKDSIARLLQQDVMDVQDTEKRDKGKWQLGALLSPQISYRDVASVDATQNAAVNQSESARLTYAGGIQVSYLPTDRLTIQSGISYNKMGVNIGDYSSFRGGWFQSELDMAYSPERSKSVVSISNSMGTLVSTDNELFVNSYAGSGTFTDYHLLVPEEMMVADASVESFFQSFEYLEIPFNVRYKVIDRGIDMQLMGGFSTNLLVNNSVSVIAGDQVIPIGEVRDIRTINYSGNVGVGVVYDLFEKFSLSVEPRFRYYLNSINASNLPATRPYSFGFYTGVNYRF